MRLTIMNYTMYVIFNSKIVPVKSYIALVGLRIVICTKV